MTRRRGRPPSSNKNISRLVSEAVASVDRSREKSLPALAYETGSGSVSAATSRRREKRRDKGGKTLSNQAWICLRLSEAGYSGYTAFELEDLSKGTPNEMHHGHASGALTNLHIKKVVNRLVEERDEACIYVLEEYVGGRPTEPPGRNKKRTDPRLGALVRLFYAGKAVAEEVDKPQDKFDDARYVTLWEKFKESLSKAEEAMNEGKKEE